MKKQKEISIALTRKVLTEKTKNSFLYIYTLLNCSKKTKNPFCGVYKQLDEGIKTSREQGLEPIEYNESWLIYKPEQIVGRCQLSLMKLVIEGRAKFIYVRKIEMLSRSKKLRNYILHLYAIYGVQLFTKKGRIKLEELVITPEIEYETDILKMMVEEHIEIPYEYVKN